MHRLCQVYTTTNQEVREIEGPIRCLNHCFCIYMPSESSHLSNCSRRVHPFLKLEDVHRCGYLSITNIRSEATCNDGFGDRAERQTELIPVSLGGVMPRGRREDNNKGQRSGNYPRSSKSISPKDGKDKWCLSMHSDIRKQGTR
jgi:hypothetical protein